jgi:TetR/AcrR family fatty acid metabolism transcriptional regulator
LDKLASQEEKKSKIFEAAERLVSEKGYEKTTMKHIAEAADVAIGTIYEYFENKDDLFLTIAAEQYALFSKELAIHYSGMKSTLEKIRKYIWVYFYFFQKDPLYSETWLLVVRVHKNLSHYKWIQESGNEIMLLLTAGQEEGVIRKDIDLYVMRQLLIGALENAMTRWLLKGRSYDMLSYSEKISDLFIDAITVK